MRFAPAVGFIHATASTVAPQQEAPSQLQIRGVDCEGAGSSPAEPPTQENPAKGSTNGRAPELHRSALSARAGRSYYRAKEESERDAELRSCLKAIYCENTEIIA